jgi:hypothetical protein
MQTPNFSVKVLAVKQAFLSNVMTIRTCIQGVTGGEKYNKIYQKQISTRYLSDRKSDLPVSATILTKGIIST